MGKAVEEVEIARFYTRSRRFPKMIGRMHDGTKIPGGPYTVTQAAVGVLLILVAVTTRAQWGTGSILVDIPIAIGIGWGAAWGAGRIPSTRRNLLSVLLGAVSAMSRPVSGTYRGTPMRIRPPHAAGGHVTFGVDVPERTAADLVAAPGPMPASVPVAAQIEPTPPTAPAPASTATTAVERLLEQARKK